MMLLQPGRVNQRTQRAYGAALLANHFAHIRLRHAYFNARGSFALNLAHVDSLGIVDEGLHHHFDRVAHRFGPNLKFHVACATLDLDCLNAHFRLRGLLDQPSHCLSRLRAFADPVLDAIALELDFRGLARWIVRTEILKERSVTLRLLFFYYDAIAGALLGAGSH